MEAPQHDEKTKFQKKCSLINKKNMRKSDRGTFVSSIDKHHDTNIYKIT